MAPLYEVIMLTKVYKDSGKRLSSLLKGWAGSVWERRGVVADIRTWGQRELAYRIRKQGKNHYHAHYLSLHVYCSPPTLRQLEDKLRDSEHVLRHMTLRQQSTPKLDAAARDPFKPAPPPAARDLEADPTESAKWQYRNLVMQRVFEGRTKQELVAEHMVRYRFQHAQQRNPAADLATRPSLAGGARVADIRPRSAPPPAE